MPFKDSGKTARRKPFSPDPVMDRVCAHCHHRYGSHYGKACPTLKQMRERAAALRRKVL